MQLKNQHIKSTLIHILIVLVFRLREGNYLSSSLFDLLILQLISFLKKINLGLDSS